jgi:hypothetical protein
MLSVLLSGKRVMPKRSDITELSLSTQVLFRGEQLRPAL